MNEEKVILMILNQRFLPDPRVEQEYLALKDAGFKVIVVADNNGRESNDFDIVRVNPSKGILNNILNLIFRKNPFLKKNIINQLKKKGINKVHAIHVHDLFWSFLGIDLNTHFKDAKLVVDLHENYPEFIKDIKQNSSKSILSKIKKISQSYKRLKKYELSTLKKCDRFIVVVEEALERFRGQSFYEKGIVVSNTKDPSLWDYIPLKEIKEKLIITYMGSVQDLRGLDSAILSMNYLDQDKHELNIVGVIKGSEMDKKFNTLISENNIKNVNIIGWINDEKKAYQYIEESHICIVPHKDTGLTQTTVPHKLFMYMATGRPVLVSDVAPLKRIVEEVNNGLIFKANNPEDFAQKIKQMRNEDKLIVFAKNGRAASQNKYRWQNDASRLIKMYENIIR